MELVQLLVQRADVVAILGGEEGQVAVEAFGFGRALGQDGLTLSDAGAELAEVFDRLLGRNERGPARVTFGSIRPA